MKYLLPAGLALGLMAVFAVGLTKDPYELPSALQDRPAPEFSLPTLANPAQNWQTADLKGQVSLVNAWGSWCVTCLQEHDQLLSLANDYSVPVFGLNYRDDRRRALAWLNRLGNPYKTNGFDADGKVAIEWGVAKAPESFVVDKQGVVRMKITGAITVELLQDELLPFIRKLQQEGG